jgi:hypothetical protein
VTSLMSEGRQAEAKRNAQASEKSAKSQPQMEAAQSFRGPTKCGVGLVGEGWR